MLTVHENGGVVGALLRTAGHAGAGVGGPAAVCRRGRRGPGRAGPRGRGVPRGRRRRPRPSPPRGRPGPGPAVDRGAADAAVRARRARRARRSRRDVPAPSARTTRAGWTCSPRGGRSSTGDRPHLAAPAHGPRRRGARRRDGCGGTRSGRSTASRSPRRRPAPSSRACRGSAPSTPRPSTAAGATPPRSRPRRPDGRSAAVPGTCCSTPTWRTRRRTGSTPAWASARATTRSNCASCRG